MKKIALLFSVLALMFVSSSVFAQFTQSEMVADWQRAKIYIKSYLDVMPEDDYGFKPTPQIGSFAQQTATDSIKQSINTFFNAMRKGDSTLSRSTLLKDMINFILATNSTIAV